LSRQIRPLLSVRSAKKSGFRKVGPSRRQRQRKYKGRKTLRLRLREKVRR
jgi:hypothetical protein